MPTGVTLARFAFGTARIHKASPLEAEHILRSAVDAGFRHFDTAPLYGYGGAERHLKVVAARTDVTIATKVGLYPPGGTNQTRLATFLRKLGGKAMPRLSRPVASGSVTAARLSFEDSLARLGRDHVEYLLIHEPQFELLQTDEWMRWLEDERKRGRVLAFGLSGEPADLLPFVQACSPLSAVLQTRDGKNEAVKLRQEGRSPDMAFGFSAFGDSTSRDAAIQQELTRDSLVRLIVSSRHPAALAERLITLSRNDAIRPRD